jgi:predicted alpha/beta-hydrolase family hydrolase
MKSEEYQIPCADYLLRLRRTSGDKERFGLILAHGAGVGMDSDFMKFFQETLAELGVRVVEFDFSYMKRGKGTPLPRKILESEWRAVIDHILQERKTSRAIFIGGKSMGGRMASYVIADYPSLAGLVFLGYPLHPPGKPLQLRTAHLFEISKPMLFVSGARDRLAQLDLLQDTIAKLGSKATLFLEEFGDHSLRVPKKSGKSTEQVWQQCCSEIVKWMKQVEVG